MEAPTKNSSYNYYLSQVLGVSHYLGASPSQETAEEAPVELKRAPAPSPIEEVVPRESVIVVVPNNLSDKEVILLEKIAVAAKFSNSFLKIPPERLNGFNLTGKTVINLVPELNWSSFTGAQDDINLIEAQPLAKMLPPTPEDEISKNKSRLWSSLKKLGL